MEVLYSFIIMICLPFAIGAFILFYVMKAAVKSATDDMHLQAKKDSKKAADKAEADELIVLRDLELLNDEELEGAIELYRTERGEREKFAEYLRFAEILGHLKEKEFLSEEQYSERSSRLKEQFEINE
jgi:hypothetical protein